MCGGGEMREERDEEEAGKTLWNITASERLFSNPFHSLIAGTEKRREDLSIMRKKCSTTAFIARRSK